MIQRFGSALNLNVHFHMLLLDGIYADNGHGKIRFYQIAAPTTQEIRDLLGVIVERVGRLLEKRGVLERDSAEPLAHRSGFSLHAGVSAGKDEKISVDVRLEEDTVWLSQEQMALLFGKARSTVAEHIASVFAEGELEQNRTCRKFRQVRQEGNCLASDGTGLLDLFH